MEVAAPVAIGVDIGDGVLAQFIIMCFGPFSGAEQAGFFAVPEAIDDSAVRLPALLEQLAERAGFFQFGTGAGERIFGAIDPSIVMVAANDPLIGILRAGDFGDDVVQRLAIPVELEMEMRFARGPGRRGR